MTISTIARLLILTMLPTGGFATSADDSTIEFETKTSFVFRIVLRNHVRVSAENGVVTLTGVVEDQADRQLAADMVGVLPGARHVIDHTVMRSSLREFSDGWLEHQIGRALQVKANVSADTTRISVRAGVVTLRGTVTNPVQGERTVACVREVAGVIAVVNNLVVAAESPGWRRHEEFVDDASITGLLRHAMRSHEDVLSGADIVVHARDGVITLTGTTSTEAVKALVLRLAGEVRGSRSVTSELVVTG